VSQRSLEAAIRDNKTRSTKNITEVGKITLYANWEIKCNRASVASEKNEESERKTI